MLLTVNPPPMLIDDTKAAPSASECAGVCGVSPPPIKCKAPAKFFGNYEHPAACYSL